MKHLPFTACLLGAILLGWMGKSIFDDFQSPKIEERTVIIAEQIRKIAQLATAEGRYGEMFNHKEVGFIDYPSFNKSVMIDAKARVIFGFNLEGISVEADESTRQLIVHNWPEPSEIAFEVDMRYFDLDQGLFNSFGSKELNEIKARMGEELKANIDVDELHQKSYEQAADLLGIINDNLQLSGWELIVAERPEIRLEKMPIAD